MTNNDYETAGYLKLSAQRALLGNISENMAAVSVELSGTHIILTFLLFGELSDDDRDYGEATATEIVADYPEGYTVEARYERFTGVKEGVVGAAKCLVYLRS